jgi:hypothetical protein
MGFPIGVLVGVSLTAYFFGGFDPRHSAGSSASRIALSYKKICRLGSSRLLRQAGNLLWL